MDNLKRIELKNYKDIQKGSLNEYSNLYPSLDDPLFNVKIYNKKEFNDLKYDELKSKDITKYLDELVKQPFELSPHQQFIRNFLSYLTPYNSALLYHGLGTGKTCSAIQVCEEARKYMKQNGIQKKIIIIASPNVQTNFKTQLFDERKLKKVDDIWDIKSCTSNSFLKEINPTNMKGLSREKIIKQIKKIISQYYDFMGYIEFSNSVDRLLKKYSVNDPKKETDEVRRGKIRIIKKEFSNSLIVIDEVHNIRSGGESPNKKLGQNIINVVRYSDNLKLLLMSATPMFNTYKEIIWLINLMNLNDNRSLISIGDIFDKYGNFKIKDGKNIGKELFIRKMTGYISFVNGESPYTFPFRIYPYYFTNTNSLLQLNQKDEDFYPERQINGQRIIQGMSFIDLFINSIGSYQMYGYLYSIQELQNQLPNIEDLEQGEKGMGWQLIENPLRTLNFVFPNKNLDNWIQNRNNDNKVFVKQLVGTEGIRNVMNYNYSKKTDYEYKDECIEKYGAIFSPQLIHNFSNKLDFFIKNVKKSNGIILIYSQYIEGGCVPIALALEEFGFKRYQDGGGKNLFKTGHLNVEPIDAKTMKKKSEINPDKFKQANYVMITGDSNLSPNNSKEIKACTDEDNMYGEKVKVIIISKAGTEGIDFNNIRQVHILEPWYNMSRIEQTIGRAVRFMSHKLLSFSQRNVEIYLYGTKIEKQVIQNNNIIVKENIKLITDNPEVFNEDEQLLLQSEPIDLYIYRQAERKAIIIGNISRVMKEYAIDCNLNKNINNLTSDYIDKDLNIILSSGKNIEYKVGYKPYSHICDYKESCQYYCKPEIPDSMKKIQLDTQNKHYLENNINQIISQIQSLFKEFFILEKQKIISILNQIRSHSLIEINYALEKMVNDPNIILIDMFGRIGKCKNIEKYYFFQPNETDNVHLGYEERSKPIDFTFDKLEITNLIDIKDNKKKLEKELTIQKTKPLTSTSKSKKIDIPKEVISDIESIEKEIIIKKFVSLINEITNNYLKSLIIKTNEQIKRGDNDWYKHVGITIQRLKTLFEKELLQSFVIEHAFDELNFKNKKLIIVCLLDKEGNNRMNDYISYWNDKEDEYKIHIKHVMKTIFDFIKREIYISNDDLHSVYLIENSKLNIYLLDNNFDFKEMTPLDKREIIPKLKKKRINIENINNNIGFMMFINSINSNVFKFKDIREKRNKGARCDQAGKINTLKILNKIVNEEKYTKTNTRNNKAIQLCSEEEFLLRGFNHIKKNNLYWFFTYENAIINEIEKIQRK